MKALKLKRLGILMEPQENKQMEAGGVLPEETVGVITNIVFPTGMDRRKDIGILNCYDIYYGIADNRISVARLDLPDNLDWYESNLID